MHASDSHVEVTRDERGTTVKLLDSSTMIAPRTPRPILDQRARDAEARHLVRHHPYPHERAVRPPPKLQHKQRAKEQLKERVGSLLERAKRRDIVWGGVRLVCFYSAD